MGCVVRVGVGVLSDEVGVYLVRGGCLVRGVGVFSAQRRGRHPPEMATAAVGTHPTGMHYCL